MRLFRCVFSLGLFLGVWHPGQALADPGIHALFVGVAEYQYSKNRSGRGSLEDLGGAPNDIAALRRTLEPRIGIDKSISLLNSEATRKQIIAAFGTLVEGAAPGDTLLFYYTGHGGRIFDQSGKQLSGFSSTIVPYDARNPDLPASEAGDILDTELRELVAAASARGINVVTIFDSCNSGTATRSPWVEEGNIRTRAAPKLVVDKVVAPASPLVLPKARSAVPARPGYVVHMAAAPDGKAAIERMSEGAWRGDFTEALVRALTELPANSTYRELLDAVRMKLRLRLQGETNARVMTDVRGEGDLDQPFLGEWSPVRLVEGKAELDGSWTLKAGSIAGIATGSRYAGYRTGSEARQAGATPVAEGRVAAVDPGAAKLTLDRPLAAGPATLYWRETARGAGASPLKLLVSGGSSEARSALEATLGDLAFAKAGRSDPDLVLDLSAPDSIHVVRAEDDSTVTRIAPNDTARLRAVLEQIARYHSLLGMIGQGTPLQVEYKLSETDCAGNPASRIAYVGGEAHFQPGVPGRDSFVLTLRNEDTRPLYPHIINLSAGYEVSLAATTGDNAKEDVLRPGHCWNWPATVSGAGRDYLILVLADKPLPGLQMLTAGAIRGTSDDDPLSQLILDAAAGRRTRGDVPAGVWSVRALSYVIEGANSDVDI